MDWINMDFGAPMHENGHAKKWRSSGIIGVWYKRSNEKMSCCL